MDLLYKWNAQQALATSCISGMYRKRSNIDYSISSLVVMMDAAQLTPEMTSWISIHTGKTTCGFMNFSMGIRAEVWVPHTNVVGPVW